MVDSTELQQMARLVDMNRQRLEDIQNQLEKIEIVILEHEDTHKALTSLAEGKQGHIPLGAGVMVNTPSNSTSLIDYGSGIFGERNHSSAAKIVSHRLEDINELKAQFEEEANQLTQRIEELAKHFEQAAEEYKTQKTHSETTLIPTEEKQTPSRRKRGFGSELTLDD